MLKTIVVLQDRFLTPPVSLVTNSAVKRCRESQYVEIPDN
jgi:hypothetical protein